MAVTIKPSEIESLAPMPVSVVQLAGMANDLNTSLSEMARVIEFDEALTANLLRLSNSVMGGSRMPILTVKDAVIRLGTAKILKLAVTQQIAGPMSHACPGYDLEEHELWRHSVASAMIAEHLNVFAFKPFPRLAFTAALMHDIGKLLLTRHIDKDSLKEIRRIIQTHKVSFKEAEHKLLGTDHAEVGGAIARHWNFPQQLVTAIEFHHEPERHPDALLDIVHIANVAAKVITAGGDSGGMNGIGSDDSIQRLGISASDLRSVLMKVKTGLEEEEKHLLCGERDAGSVP